jgi:hypothetical protein
LICDALELFKTEDSPKVRKEALGGAYPRVQAAYDRIQAHPNQFYHESILK